METIIAFAAGYLLSWPSLLALVLLGVWTEHADSRGWAVFFWLVALAISYFFFGLTLSNLPVVGAVYLALGIVWSFWRYKRYLRGVTDELKRDYPSADKTDYVRRRMAQCSPSNMASTITAWVIIWPASFIGNMLGDFMDMLQEFITKFFKGVYHRLYQSAMADVERNG